METGKLVSKNTLMIYLSTFVVCLSLFVHLLHRIFGFLDNYLALQSIGNITGGMQLLQNIFLIIPIILLIASFVYYKTAKDHKAIPDITNIYINICKYIDYRRWRWISRVSFFNFYGYSTNCYVSTNYINYS